MNIEMEELQTNVTGGESLSEESGDRVPLFQH
jgi:hypothetical protein